MKTGEKDKKTLGSSKSNRVTWVCSLLNKQRAKYLIVGGIAANLHGLLRTTKDIDLLIPKDEKNTAKILQALEGLTFGIAKELDPHEVSKKPITIIGDIPRVDLLTVANQTHYERAKKGALKTKIENVTIPYIDFPTLIQTKQTGRTQDQADIEQLRKIKKK